MNQDIQPDTLPAELLADVARVVGAEVTLLGRLPGGFDVGAVRVQVGDGAQGVLKSWPLVRPGQLDEALRTQRVVKHMRDQGYPTPDCLGVGATGTHVWHLMEFIDAAPAEVLTPAIVEQMMEIAEIQAGQATEPYDHWAYSWRIATGRDYREDLAPELTKAIAALPKYFSEVAALVARIRLMCADTPPPRTAPDMVHADFKPDNALVRDGVVVAMIDIGNAGSGTRATDLATLQWYAFEDGLEESRKRVWARIIDIVGWEGAAVVTATQILVSLEFPMRKRWHHVVAEAIERGHRMLDELEALRP